MRKRPMSCAFFLILIFFTLSGCGGGGKNSSGSIVSKNTAILIWYAPTTNSDGTPLTDLAGCKIYYGTSSGKYTEIITMPLEEACKKSEDKMVTECTRTIEGLAPGTYYFAVTAYDTDGNESVYSNEASKKIE